MTYALSNGIWPFGSRCDIFISGEFRLEGDFRERFMNAFKCPYLFSKIIENKGKKSTLFILSKVAPSKCLCQQSTTEIKNQFAKKNRSSVGENETSKYFCHFCLINYSDDQLIENVFSSC